MHKDETKNFIYRRVPRPYLSNYKDFIAFTNRIKNNI